MSRTPYSVRVSPLPLGISVFRCYIVRGCHRGHLRFARNAKRPQPTEYFVSLADPARHVAHVSIRLREGNGNRTLDMPVWNALYQVRNFAANIEDVRAQDASGAPAEVRNTRTSEWEITAPAGCIVVSYDIHLDSPGPFGSSLNADHGFFNWAMVLMYSPALRSQPVSLRLLDVPASWALRDLHVLGAAEPGKVSKLSESPATTMNWWTVRRSSAPFSSRHFSRMARPTTLW